MKQILQNLSSGETQLVEVPAVKARPGGLLIRTRASLVSVGTERMLVDFGRAGWVEKARQQPEKVRMVREKIRTDGLLPTFDAVRSQLDQPLPLGYCNVGVVEETGSGLEGFSQGDRVVSNGPHAELVSVPRNLCARIPDAVSDDEAAFTVISSIALQGIRLSQPTLGECFVVTGLGLIGLMVVQLLRAHGCRVLGIDLDESKLALARNLGAQTVNPGKGEEVLAAAERFSRGRGVDGVLLTLAAKSSEPVSQAAQMCRKRGRIVLVGVTGLELNRSDFYEKELSLQVSCSYGPGRYDLAYEEKGQDYPIGFVRWTEQRNFEAVLDMMADGRLQVASLISHRFPFDRAPEAYDLLVADEPNLGILLEYARGEGEVRRDRTIALTSKNDVSAKPVERAPRVSFIGAGNYAGRILIPAFNAAGAELNTVVTGSGVGGVHYGEKYGFRHTSTDTTEVWGGDDDAVVVATRHNTHAELVISALQSGKHVFVEKPLALTLDEIGKVESVLERASGQMLMVGFNRRFAPHVVRMKSLLESTAQPKSFVMTVNAGAVPSDHWTQDREVGGGRIVGEACHFIDLLRFLAGSEIAGWSVASMADAPDTVGGDDCAALTLQFADGSFGTIHYLANGHKAVPKERLEVYCGGRILQLDNYRRMRGYGWSSFQRTNLWRQDKGQRRCAAAFIDAVSEGGPAPIPAQELLEVSRVSIACAELARSGFGLNSE